MTDSGNDQRNVIPISAKPPKTQQSASRPALSAQAQAMLAPAAPEVAVALVASCLVLVRAVGMSQREADDWLQVAAGEVANYPADILADACRDARRTVTHHAKIVPTIVKIADERLAERRRAAERRGPEPLQLSFQVARDWWQPTQADLDEVHAAASAELAKDTDAKA